jgi:long-chain fatty acid transport protein
LLPAYGNGFYIPVQDPFATARGNAWVASVDGPAAVYYNPAGLVQADEASLQVGVYSVYLGLEATTAGTTVKSDASWELIPQLYGVLPLNDRWVTGFGINTPFGLSTDWPNTGPFRAVTTLTELEYVTGWAVVGYRVSDSFSLGGGVGLHHADARLRQGVVPAPAQFQFEGSDQGLSWMLSALWKPHEQHSLGLVYRSHTDFDLDGDVSVTGLPVVPGSLDFMTPATAAIGYAFEPSDEWAFEVNIEWVDWERLDSLRLSPAAIYPGQSLPFHWDSNFIYSAGVTRRFGDGWSVNAGYNYIENSQPDLTFNPAIADADRHWLNVGVGRDYGDISWFLAYQYAFSNRQVTGAAVPLVNGKYKSRFHSVSLNVTWDF